MDDTTNAKQERRGGYRPPLLTHWPKPPKNFSRIEQEAWVSICKDLDEIGTLEVTDAKIIGIYCEDFALKERIRSELQDSLTLTSETRRNPLIEPLQRQLAKLQSVLNDLGLTPAARKAKATTKQADNPYTKMMAEGV